MSTSPGTDENAGPVLTNGQTVKANGNPSTSVDIEDPQRQNSKGAEGTGDGDGDDNSTLRYEIYHSESVKDDEELTPYVLADSFRSRASLPGLSEIHTAASGIKRIIWVILTVIAFSLLLVHTICQIVRYAKFETNAQYEIITHKTIDFPAVTICNNNLIIKQKGQGATGESIRQYNNSADFLKLNNITLGHQRQDLIVKASFNNHKLDELDMEFQHFFSGYYGNCYTFNLDGHRKTRRSLPGYGLELVLNIERYKHYVGDDQDPPEYTGAVVKLHMPGTEPMMEEGGIFLEPSTLNRLAVRKTQVERLNGRYSDCIADDDEDKPKTYYSRNYTKEQCENTCLQKEIIKQCCCYIKEIKRDLSDFEGSWNDPQLCYKSEIQSCNGTNFDCWNRVWDDYDTNKLKCDHCRDRCNITGYRVTTTTTNWPSQEYKPKLFNKLNTNERLLGQLFKYTYTPERKGRLTNDIIKDNFLKVQIYYETMTTTYVKDVPAVADTEFVSEMNSAVGFWAGWTVWTVFQFLEFLADLVTLYIRKKRNKNEPKNKTQANANDKTKARSSAKDKSKASGEEMQELRARKT